MDFDSNADSPVEGMVVAPIPATGKGSKPRRQTVRLNVRHQDMIREKIRGTMLIVRLQAFALGRKINGNVVNMSSEQVRAAFGLLNKILPDLKQVELVGDPDRPVEVRAHDVTEATANQLTNQTPSEAVVGYESLIFGNDTTAPASGETVQ